MTARGPLLAALDVGTRSVRALLVDAEGRVVASAARGVTVSLGEDTRAEDLYLAVRDQYGRASPGPEA